jgi:hypothetical protein
LIKGQWTNEEDRFDILYRVGILFILLLYIYLFVWIIFWSLKKGSIVEKKLHFLILFIFYICNLVWWISKCINFAQYSPKIEVAVVVTLCTNSIAAKCGQCGHNWSCHACADHNLELWLVQNVINIFFWFDD